jgi:hypothetical protein
LFILFELPTNPENTMESLNDEDIEWLAKVANRLIRMRKREAANTNSPLMIEALGDTIKEVVNARSWLGARLNRKLDSIG